MESLSERKSYITGNSYENHDILMHRGQWLLKCYKTGKETYNPAYVNNKVCPTCGPLIQANNDQPVNGDHAIENEPKPIEPIIPKLSTTVVCDKCQLVMEETAKDTFYCRNGHKKALYSIVDAELKKAKEQLTSKCPFCKKQVTIEQESTLGNKRKIRYSCGHSEFIPLTIENVSTSRDHIWSKLYEFQREGVEFIEKAGGSGLIGDEMGLGKTVQALAFHRYNYSETTPCLMICESSKVYDWQMEFNSWVKDKFNEIRDEPIIHQKGTLPLCPGFKNHIISMSLLQKPKVLQSVLDYGFKLVIIDESHSFKSDATARTKALQTITKKIPNRIFLSGTPIMNKVMEYFVPLNILKPEIFSSKSYIEDRCMKSPSGRILGLRESYRPRFFHQISELVIRRTKKDAGIKLPKFRDFKKQVSIESNKLFVQKYNAVADQIEKLLADKSERFRTSSTIIGALSHLRQIIGAAKVPAVEQLAREFLENMDSDYKLAIGVHHKVVMESLAKVLAEYNPICISDEDAKVKMRKLDDFRQPENRLAILSIIGMGQGHNIQFCKNAIIAEREWSPTREDQFKQRFHRIEYNADGTLKNEFDDAKDSVTIDTLNVARSIDTFFDELVELKSKVVGSTMDENTFYEEDTMLELASRVAQTRMYWTPGATAE